MSFSRSVKQELSRIRLRGERVKRAGLLGLIPRRAPCGWEDIRRRVHKRNARGRAVVRFARILALRRAGGNLAAHYGAQAYRVYDVTLTGPGAEPLLTQAGLFRRTGDGGAAAGNPRSISRYG
jgi:hypothetical protein